MMAIGLTQYVPVDCDSESSSSCDSNDVITKWWQFLSLGNVVGVVTIALLMLLFLLLIGACTFSQKMSAYHDDILTPIISPEDSNNSNPLTVGLDFF